ncbi:hypothetical protein PGTUg99_022180 [Puccinia graminis f. sp. tritici]|uniref:Uncharacterized protein n=1 Tax=Puccinia graminis f. sp. tritici TaxID=56615 RepID=A0A5B0M9W0_PUCGR|nr:hypothetical protein PGTUg99_022180 [Puccinia graminis f. sp. tritici]
MLGCAELIIYRKNAKSPRRSGHKGGGDASDGIRSGRLLVDKHGGGKLTFRVGLPPGP